MDRLEAELWVIALRAIQHGLGLQECAPDYLEQVLKIAGLPSPFLGLTSFMG
jgi:hypothetical protein